jgi:hypothetical protein
MIKFNRYALSVLVIGVICFLVYNFIKLKITDGYFKEIIYPKSYYENIFMVPLEYDNIIAAQGPNGTLFIEYRTENFNLALIQFDSLLIRVEKLNVKAYEIENINFNSFDNVSTEQFQISIASELETLKNWSLHLDNVLNSKITDQIDLQCNCNEFSISESENLIVSVVSNSNQQSQLKIWNKNNRTYIAFLQKRNFFNLNLNSILNQKLH